MWCGACSAERVCIADIPVAVAVVVAECCSYQVASGGTIPLWCGSLVVGTAFAVPPPAGPLLSLGMVQSSFGCEAAIPLTAGGGPSAPTVSEAMRLFVLGFVAIGPQHLAGDAEGDDGSTCLPGLPRPLCDCCNKYVGRMGLSW